MSNNTTIYLKDYQYPVYVINRTELSFELEELTYSIYVLIK